MITQNYKKYILCIEIFSSKFTIFSLYLFFANTHSNLERKVYIMANNKNKKNQNNSLKNSYSENSKNTSKDSYKDSYKDNYKDSYKDNYKDSTKDCR